MSIFLQKNSVFWPKKYLYSKRCCESCVRDFLVLFSVFVREKVPITEKITFADSVSGIRPPDCSKLAKNPKNDNDVIIFRHDVNIKLFSKSPAERWASSETWISHTPVITKVNLKGQLRHFYYYLNQKVITFIDTLDSSTLRDNLITNHQVDYTCPQWSF